MREVRPVQGIDLLVVEAAVLQGYSVDFVVLQSQHFAVRELISAGDVEVLSLLEGLVEPSFNHGYIQFSFVARCHDHLVPLSQLQRHQIQHVVLVGLGLESVG